MSKQLIMTGDDFGLAIPVNEAIEQAYLEGVLTTTSLMIGERAAQDAVARARRNPGLRVGLHVAVCEGYPVLSPHEIPDLVESVGKLYAPLQAALRFAVLPVTRSQLEAEIRAQFAAFHATGLTLDHVNCHNNMQLHPAVLPILTSVAKEYGAKAIRLPYEPLLPSWRAAHRGFVLRCAAWLGLAPWAAHVKRRLRGMGFHTNDYLFGMYDCGAMDLDLLLRLVRNLPDGLSELHCHPATRRCAEIDETMPGYQHEAELEALISSELRAALLSAGVDSIAGFSGAIASEVLER